MTTTKEASVEYLQEVCRSANVPDEESASWISAVSDRNPGIISFIEKLLNTGSVLAREGVLAEVAERVDLFSKIIDYGPMVESPYDQIDAPNLNVFLMCGWTAGNVESELPQLAIAGTDFSAAIMYWENFMNPEMTDLDRTHDVGYWRGIAILVLIDAELDAHTNMQKSEAVRFASLPSGHPDLQREIDLINERDSYDADLIADLLQQAEGITGSLVNGIL